MPSATWREISTEQAQVAAEKTSWAEYQSQAASLNSAKEQTGK